MKHIYKLLFFILLVSCTKVKQGFSIKYPNINKKISIDTIARATTIDPYRNLEDLQNPIIKNWFLNQGALTDSILSGITPENHRY